MKIDDIYKELKQHYDFQIPSDALKNGHQECIELITKIRSGQDFCTFYLNLCFEQLSKNRQILSARQRQVKLQIEESLKANKYADTIRSVMERRKLIEIEAENAANLTEVEEVISKLEHLKDALNNTLSNLRNAKEQLNMALKAAQLDWEIQRNGQYTGKVVDDANEA